MSQRTPLDRCTVKPGPSAWVSYSQERGNHGHYWPVIKALEHRVDAEQAVLAKWEGVSDGSAES